MKLCIIVNPQAGKKQGLAAAGMAAHLLLQNDITVETLMSSDPGHTVAIAAELDLSSWNDVLAVGGDTTLFELITGLLRSNDGIPIPIGQVPVGTGNSFIRDLGINSIEDTIKHILGRNVLKVDLGHFSCAAGEHDYFNLTAGFYPGFVSNVVYRAKKYRSRFTGGNMMMAAAAAIDDGLLDIVLLNRIPRATLLKLLPRIFKGTQVRAESVEVFRGKKNLLRTEHPLPLTFDGESFGSTPIEVCRYPRKVEMSGCSS